MSFGDFLVKSGPFTFHTKLPDLVNGVYPTNFIESFKGSETLFIFAAGNDYGPRLYTHALYNNVIPIGSAEIVGDGHWQKLKYSSYASDTKIYTQGAAPNGQIGTSFAAPSFTAELADLLARKTVLSIKQGIEELSSSGIPIKDELGNDAKAIKSPIDFKSIVEKKKNAGEDVQDEDFGDIKNPKDKAMISLIVARNLLKVAISSVALAVTSGVLTPTDILANDLNSNANSTGISHHLLQNDSDTLIGMINEISDALIVKTKLQPDQVQELREILIEEGYSEFQANYDNIPTAIKGILGGSKNSPPEFYLHRKIPFYLWFVVRNIIQDDLKTYLPVIANMINNCDTGEINIILGNRNDVMYMFRHHMEDLDSKGKAKIDVKASIGYDFYYTWKYILWPQMMVISNDNLEKELNLMNIQEHDTGGFTTNAPPDMGEVYLYSRTEPEKFKQSMTDKRTREEWGVVQRYLNQLEGLYAFKINPSDLDVNSEVKHDVRIEEGRVTEDMFEAAGEGNEFYEIKDKILIRDLNRPHEYYLADKYRNKGDDWSPLEGFLTDFYDPEKIMKFFHRNGRSDHDWEVFKNGVSERALGRKMTILSVFKGGLHQTWLSTVVTVKYKPTGEITQVQSQEIRENEVYFNDYKFQPYDIDLKVKAILELRMKIAAHHGNTVENNKSALGGIDLTSSNKILQNQAGSGEIKFHMDPALLQQLQNAPGFVPVIINIQSLKNLQEFLGVNYSP